ncbi:hypothetical protein CRG98_023790 [Punica granatum]|uniref:Uncharacterized protein n=1 Tax=Punica granatum TaxID=22663 RepID=A0A2I0JHW3_PUNGR|nr:hypothetical protein CRG98_023790 [Punica granatum]
MRAPMQRGLGVSTFPWGRATDAREKESPLTVYDPRSRAVKSPGSKVRQIMVVDSLREPRPRVFGLTRLQVAIDQLDRFDTQTSRSPIGILTNE